MKSQLESMHEQIEKIHTGAVDHVNADILHRYIDVQEGNLTTARANEGAWEATAQGHYEEVHRLTGLAKDAIKSLTDEIGTGDDPVAFVCAAYVESRREIAALKAGACRFHCRVRSAMWMRGFQWAQERWPGLHQATSDQRQDEYDKWRNQDHDQHG